MTGFIFYLKKVSSANYFHWFLLVIGVMLLGYVAFSVSGECIIASSNLPYSGNNRLQPPTFPEKPPSQRRFAYTRRDSQDRLDAIVVEGASRRIFLTARDT